MKYNQIFVVAMLSFFCKENGPDMGLQGPLVVVLLSVLYPVSPYSPSRLQIHQHRTSEYLAAHPLPNLGFFVCLFLPVAFFVFFSFKFSCLYVFIWVWV